MNNYCCACGAYLKAPPQPFTISNFLLHYHFALSFFNPPQSRQPHHRRHPALSITSHYPNFKFAPSAQPQFFILHFSFFILPHRRQPRTIPRPALSKIEIRAIGATTILHSSFFIFHSPSSPPTPHYPSPRTIKNRNSCHRRNHNSSFFIFHSSFIKAPPSPLSPSFLSAPFSHFLTASYCCRVYCSPTAYSLSFSCRPLSSPRFS